MRIRFAAAIFACSILLAQRAPTSTDWRSAIMGLPDRPSANTSVRDIERFEDTVRQSAPYLAVPQAGNIAANRDLVRRMWTYLVAMDAISRAQGVNGGLGLAVGRARGTLMGLGLAYPYWLNGLGNQPAPEPAAAPRPVKLGEPPFSVQAPELTDVPPAERSEADELSGRYETAAAHAAAAWQSADVLRQSLAARSMSLNPRISASIGRLQVFLDAASGDLRKRQWKSARENLERVEYVTSQVTNSVGK